VCVCDRRGMARGQGGMQDAHPSGLPAWENMKVRRKEGAGGLMLHCVIAKHRSAPHEEESPLCRRSTAPPALMLVEWSQPNTRGYAKKPPNDTVRHQQKIYKLLTSMREHPLEQPPSFETSFIRP